MMSKQMITGNEYSGDTVRSGSFKKIQYAMVETSEGLGLLDKAIIDQHFVARSRYNRLLSVLAAYTTTACIGVDEGTAIIVQGNKVTVTGEGQVVRLTLPLPRKLTHKEKGLVNLQNIRMDIYISGDSFTLN